MKKKLMIVAVLAALTATPTLATPDHNDDGHPDCGQGGCKGGDGGNGGNGGNGGTGGNGGAGGNSSAEGVGVAHSYSGSEQGQIQGQKQTTNVSGNNSQQVVVNHNQPENQVLKYEGGYKVRNVPSVSLGGPASGVCNGFSGGVGGSGVGFGFAVNTSTVDKGCAQRETARIAAMLGRMDIAHAVLENIDIVKEALASKNSQQ